MLVAARDEDGMACVFDSDKIKWNGFAWTAEFYGSATCLFVREEAEPFCRNIPPGEKRVIDLEKSVIVHVAPPKTPVQELVEACEFLDHCKKTDTTDCMRAIRRALARVKEAANAK